jgi:hypothetical protein
MLYVGRMESFWMLKDTRLANVYCVEQAIDPSLSTESFVLYFNRLYTKYWLFILFII